MRDQPNERSLSDFRPSHSVPKAFYNEDELLTKEPSPELRPLDFLLAFGVVIGQEFYCIYMVIHRLLTLTSLRLKHSSHE